MVAEVTLVDQSGDTFRRDVRITDSDDNPIDITGWTFYFTVKENREDADSDAIVQRVVTSHDNPTNGETSFELTATETEALFGDYWYDMKYKTAGGVVDSFLAGVLRIEDSITDSTA